MEREILFRAKRIDTKEWVEGDLVHRNGKIYVFPQDGLDSADRYEVIPETVGQFTGLTDKNGKKIYIGDILQDNDNKYIIRESRLGWLMYQGDRHSTTMWIHKYEIIGNIHTRRTK